MFIQSIGYIVLPARPQLFVLARGGMAARIVIKCIITILDSWMFAQMGQNNVHTLDIIYDFYGCSVVSIPTLYTVYFLSVHI